jgi:hypothetical protein
VGAPARDDGARHAPFGDELGAGARLRLGRSGGGARDRWGNGAFVGATLDELMHGQAWGALVGYSITMSATMRR